MSSRIHAVLAELRAAHDQVAGELRQRLEAAEGRATAAEDRAHHLAAEVGTQRELSGRLAGELAAAREAAMVLQNEVEAERARALEAIQRAAEAQGRLEAGYRSPAVRAGKALRGFLDRWKRP